MRNQDIQGERVSCDLHVDHFSTFTVPFVPRPGRPQATQLIAHGSVHFEDGRVEHVRTVVDPGVQLNPGPNRVFMIFSPRRAVVGLNG